MMNLVLTKEMFEASKILAPAIVRGRASLYFDGYGIRKHLKIIGSMSAGKKPRIRIITEVEFKRTVHEFELSEYLQLQWDYICDLLLVLDEQPVWITLNGHRETGTAI
jgi:hypothetical protein